MIPWIGITIFMAIETIIEGWKIIRGRNKEFKDDKLDIKHVEEMNKKSDMEVLK